MLISGHSREKRESSLLWQNNGLPLLRERRF